MYYSRNNYNNTKIIILYSNCNSFNGICRHKVHIEYYNNTSNNVILNKNEIYNLLIDSLFKVDYFFILY